MRTLNWLVTLGYARCIVVVGLAAVGGWLHFSKVVPYLERHGKRSAGFNGGIGYLIDVSRAFKVAETAG